MEYIKEREAAKILNVRVELLRAWRTQKRGVKYYILPYGRVRYTKKDIEEFLKNNIKEGVING